MRRNSASRACPVPVDIAVTGCEDSVVFDAGDVYLESMGRILQLDVNLKNVCPNRRVALGVILTEVDAEGNEYQRGVKAITVPAHSYPTCRDVLVKCINFVLPEELSLARESSGSMCGARSFKARLIAHNIDSDFECCDLLQ